MRKGTNPALTYHKVYVHDFDSIGSWWAMRFGKPTGVALPWGVLSFEYTREIAK